jgi:hypothetical protein
MEDKLNEELEAVEQILEYKGKGYTTGSSKGARKGMTDAESETETRRQRLQEPRPETDIKSLITPKALAAGRARLMGKKTNPDGVNPATGLPFEKDDPRAPKKRVAKKRPSTKKKVV